MSNNTIKCLLVDDEPPAITLMQQYVGMVDQLEIVDSVYSAVKAFDILKDTEVDLMFLDIQMPVLNGIDFIKTLRNPPAIILTTAYREYALDGYDLDIIDYLLKPISFNRFLKSIDRYRHRQQITETATQTINEIPEHIFLTVNRSQHKVILDEIFYIESLKDYVRIHTTKESIVVKGNIGTTLERLSSDRFVRIHRSYAVASKHVKSYNQRELTIADQKLPIGVRYRNQVNF